LTSPYFSICKTSFSQHLRWAAAGGIRWINVYCLFRASLYPAEMRVESARSSVVTLSELWITPEELRSHFVKQTSQTGCMEDAVFPVLIINNSTIIYNWTDSYLQ